MPNNTNNKGLFLTVEGGEGAGKSTNMQTICDYLTEQNIDFVVTREPGGTDLAEEIRDVLLTPRTEKVSDKTELLLMFAARAQHLAEKIEPALEAGKWVVCDRFTDATYAYQGGGRQMDQQLIADLETLVQGELRPDCTFLFDISVEQGMARASQRGELDRFEQEQLAFFERVRATYQAQAKAQPQRYRVIDAGADRETVANAVRLQLQQLIQAVS